jgi:hypothetical protein
VSAAKDPASPPREPRERGAARDRLAPPGKDPAHPANPARPFRGAGSRAWSGGLAATIARGRPVANRRSRGSSVVMARRLADHAAVPEVSPGGRGGPPTAAAAPAPQDRTALTRRAVTLSDENALSRSKAPCTHTRRATGRAGALTLEADDDLDRRHPLGPMEPSDLPPATGPLAASYSSTHVPSD